MVADCYTQLKKKKSTMKLPVYKDSSKKGEDGITILKRIVENELKWVFRVNHKEHDFGIDAYFDIISETNQITGKTIAVQVKTGLSYFKEKNEYGWIYRGSISHLNYYLNHQIPVIIIIVDEIKSKAFWCLCDASKTESAGKNWKIIIPFTKEMNAESKSELLEHISPVRDYASQLESFWKENKLIKESGRISIKIDREFVENNSPHELISLFERLQVNSDVIAKTREKVDIFIDGYNDDPRELTEIPEFCNWLKDIFNKVNGWSYFLAKENTAFFLRLIVLVHVKFKEVGGIVVGELGIPAKNVELETIGIIPIIEMLYDDLNKFTEKHNIPEEINKEISKNLFEYLTGKRSLIEEK